MFAGIFKINLCHSLIKLPVISPSVPIPPRQWISIRPEGVYCAPGDFYIDPFKPVPRAVVTHGHADHARSGHGEVYATPETLAIMAIRYGKDFTQRQHPVAYGTTVDVGQTKVTLEPAGHILGSAQAAIEYGGSRIVFSGDYKRHADPTCSAFRPVACDVFVTEATFGLPVFRHPPIQEELKKLLVSLELFPDRCHLIGVYALGKCQRVMMELRQLGYAKPFYVHGALVKLCQFYIESGYELGEVIPVSDADKKALGGEIVFAPPSALADRWSRSFPNVMTCAASGWMQIRARAKQKLVELPLVVSDHADWPDLLRTLQEVGAPEVWITHGREDALVYQAEKMGLRTQVLSLLGYEDDDDS
ncbi:MAG: ligase-associated DNA damage response exonuclease [Sphingobacteriales bacterium]|nr:MAG: ligase-associated DNA damage response exonuclease [Sphingobacteriales bacterium]